MKLSDRVQDDLRDETLDLRTVRCLRQVIKEGKGLYHVPSHYMVALFDCCINEDYCPLRLESHMTFCTIYNYNKEVKKYDKEKTVS